MLWKVAVKFRGFESLTFRNRELPGARKACSFLFGPSSPTVYWQAEGVQTKIWCILCTWKFSVARTPAAATGISNPSQNPIPLRRQLTGRRRGFKQKSGAFLHLGVLGCSDARGSDRDLQSLTKPHSSSPTVYWQAEGVQTKIWCILCTWESSVARTPSAATGISNSSQTLTLPSSPTACWQAEGVQTKIWCILCT